MKMEWYCCSCKTYRNLSRSGTCEVCDSSAMISEVGHVEPVYLPSAPEWSDHKIMLWIGLFCLIGSLLLLAEFVSL